MEKNESGSQGGSFEVELGKLQVLAQAHQQPGHGEGDDDADDKEDLN